MNITVSEYTVSIDIPSPLKAVVVSDLHDRPVCSRVIERLGTLSPDMILIPGDLFERFEEERYALSFLKDAADISEVYYSIGNHDRLNGNAIRLIDNSGAVLLDNTCIKRGRLNICGLTSGVTSGGHHTKKTPPPDIGRLTEFSALGGPKLLLCHHPEYYPKYIRDRDIDLTVSGHAHGGQWRIFGQGIYAPGQGIFPKYTAGVHEGRLVISRGLANHTFIPRIFNPPEIVLLNIIPKNRTEK